MRIPAVLLSVLLASCGLKSKQENPVIHDVTKDSKTYNSNDSIVIMDSEYVSYINGLMDTFYTVSEFKNILQRNRPNSREDTICIYMRSSIADRMSKISSILRELKINNYHFIITEDYFALPYPKQTE